MVEKKKMSHFYCLFVEGTEGFSKQHFTQDEARIEAERLARKERRRVYLLVSNDYCELEPPSELPIRWRSL